MGIFPPMVSFRTIIEESQGARTNINYKGPPPYAVYSYIKLETKTMRLKENTKQNLSNWIQQPFYFHLNISVVDEINKRSWKGQYFQNKKSTYRYHISLCLASGDLRKCSTGIFQSHCKSNPKNLKHKIRNDDQLH